MHLVPDPFRRRVALVGVLAAAVAAATCSPIRVSADGGAPVGIDGVITAFAGAGSVGAGGDGGPALAARMSSPGDVAVGGDGAVYVADTGNHRLRRIDPDGTIATVAGTGLAGSGADGVPATEVALNLPAVVALDADGNLYVADTGNHSIRRVESDGTIMTVAGTGTEAFSGDGGPAGAAHLRSPGGLAFGPDGSLYVADSLNHRVRRIDHDGTITTVAGTGAAASAGDGGAATSAALNLPRGLVFDGSGNLYIAESGGHRLRRVAGDGTITTSAGTGTRGFAGDGGPAKQARLSEPQDVDVDGAGNVYIADTSNHRIRLVTPDGMIHTTAGIGDAGDEGDQGLAVWAEIDAPRGLGLDAHGNLLIADTRNHRIRLVAGPVPAPPGTGVGRVQPTVETDPVGGTVDAADDPAIWPHPTDPAKSLLIGTDKHAEVLEVYDLTTGHLLQQIPDATASLNNVDVRTGFTLAGQVVDLVVTSGADLAVYKVDVDSRRLVDVTARRIRPAHGVQGVCLYSDRDAGKLYAFSTIGSGYMEQFELFDNAGKVDARSVRGPWDVNPANPVVEDGEIEACAVDDETGRLYVSEQDVGIWKYGAEPDDGTSAGDRSLVAGTTWHNGGLLAPDVEGLAIVPQPDGGGWLIASSQGDDTFVVYERAEPHAFVRKFRTVNGVVDACSHTDGLDALAVPLGPAFPAGVFVCQDNSDTLPGTNGNQSFKLIPLERVVPLAASDPDPDPVPTTTTTTRPPTTTTTTTPTTTTTTTPTTTTTTTATTTTTTTTTIPTSPDPAVSDAGAEDRAPVAPSLAGYWMLGGDGAVYPFGEASHHGAPRLSAGTAATDIEPTPTGRGYWILDDDGTLTAHGDARSLAAARFPNGERATALSATPSGRGAWVFSDRGRVVAVGDAMFRGDLSGKSLNGPVLDSIATPTGNGYYMVASDGGIFAFGDAAFHGSMGGVRLNAPVQSLVPDPDGRGYWLVASDGGVFAFDAGFRGSMGGRPLNRPVTGMVAYGDGYLMVAEDGGIFSFSNRAFVGSLAASPPAVPIRSVAALPTHR